MDSGSTLGPGSPLRVIGSLWFAAVLLVLLLVAMACATVYESMHGTERALHMFYRSWWFECLLALLAVNVASAVIVRLPLSRRHIGFAMTHCAILITLAGALVTKHFGLDGQVGIYEKQSVVGFSIPEPTLAIFNRAQQTRSTIDLPKSVFTGFDEADGSGVGALALDNVRVETVRYVPDSKLIERMVDGDPQGRPAIEVSLIAHGRQHTAWLFDRQTARVGPLPASFRVAASQEELTKLLTEVPEAKDHRDGVVKIAYQGSTFELPLGECLEKEMPLQGTDYTVRVLRYLPHATVGAENKLVNTSDRPENPAIELQITGPAGTERRVSFARFPDFSSMHGESHVEDLKVTFVAPAGGRASAVPIEVLAGVDGSLHVRFNRDGVRGAAQVLRLGEGVESPWSEQEFAVVKRYDRARRVRGVEPISPVRKKRKPAVNLEITAGEHTSELWLQKHQSRALTINGVAYDLAFADKDIPLGFKITLNRFRVGYYPGGSRPRSFESHVTITEASTGRASDRLISMNHPTGFGGYTFYQSSYSEAGGRTASVLSVSRDPGQPIVFFGYILMMAGMVVVLITRMLAQRRLTQRDSIGAAGNRDGKRTVDLLDQEGRCTSGLVSAAEPASSAGGG